MHSSNMYLNIHCLTGTVQNNENMRIKKEQIIPHYLMRDSREKDTSNKKTMIEISRMSWQHGGEPNTGCVGTGVV